MTALMLSACFVSTVLPEPKKKKTSLPSPAEKKPRPPDAVGPQSLPPHRLLRRLALDLTGRLPLPSDFADLSDEAETYNNLLEHYLGTPEATASIASLQRRMWQLRADHLPDLLRLAEAGDATAAAISSSQLRYRLIEEPVLRMRYILDTNRPLHDLFAGSWTIIHPDLIGYYDLTSEGQAWPGEIYQFTEYNDGRPELGILTSNGILATEDSRGIGDALHRASQLISRFTCSNLSYPQAHTFTDLSENELASDLNQLATTKASCRGCHAIWNDAATAVTGLGLGSNFDSWHRYQAQQNVSGTWSGLAFTDGASLGELIGSDSRTHRCTIERLILALLQRPLTSDDKLLMTTAIEAFNADSQRLMTVLPAILRSDHYRYGPVSPDVAGLYQRSTSGIRFLRRDQWQGIIRQLSYGGASIELPESLDAGFDESITSDDQIPSGGYWYSVDRVARQLASLIVSEELRTGRDADTRRVLKKLPSGTGTKASATMISDQILASWQLLSSDTKIDKTTAPVTLFIAMWQELNPDESEEKFQNAWRAILTAMLSHQNFIMY